MEIQTNHPDDLSEAAKTLIEGFPDERIFLFYGEMGAGKTTFISAICKVLGVEGPTSSPTFSIVNEYASPFGPVFHFDFYRLRDEMEALDLGCEEYFLSGGHCFVEWPEKIPNLLPADATKVVLTVRSPTSRTISVQ